MVPAPLEFLLAVWGNRQGFVDLPAKVAGRWVPATFEWPEDRKSVMKRVATSNRDEEDLYFTPAMFSQSKRDRNLTLPSNWLWADLDEADPEDLARLGLLPTVAWESSPGRSQALWKLTKDLKPQLLERLNQMVTYTVGADKSGWDLTQVLRVPGTKNYKYNPPVPVELLWFEADIQYSPSEVFKRIKKLGVSIPTITPQGDLIEGGRKPRLKDLPARAKRLLRTPADQVVTGERSARLWELECLLCEHGVDEQGIFLLVRQCAWNKYTDRRDGDEMLRREIRRAHWHVRGRHGGLSVDDEADEEDEADVEPDDAEGKGRRPVDGDPKTDEQSARKGSGDVDDGSEHDSLSLPFVDYATFVSKTIDSPRWLIEEVWTAASHGIIGGEPKTLKSVLSLAMGVSVASGKPFLNRYEVRTRGPVLVVQEENAPWQVQDRVRKLARFAGLIRKREIEVEVAPKGALGTEATYLEFPDDIPLFFLNNYGFDLTVAEHRDALEYEVQRVRPVLVILDPLYLLLGGVDTNQSHQLAPFFQWLLYIRYEYNCAIAIVHHMGKRTENHQGRRPGQRLLGSTTLHGFVESGLYSENQTDETMKDSQIRLRVEREFRNVGPRRPLDVVIEMGEPGSLDFQASVAQYDLTGRVVSVVEQEPGITLTALAEILEVDKRTARKYAVGSGALELQNAGKAGRGNVIRVYPMGHQNGAGEE